MLVLITGENGSGKSQFAERLIAETAFAHRYYIATLRPCTPEGWQKVSAHQKQREGLGFVTMETPCGLNSLAILPDSAILLEDVSNLLSNRMFERQDADPISQCEEEIKALAGRCGLLVAVTIGGLSEEGYEGATKRYIADLNLLNERLLALADTAVQLHRHRPVLLKGALHLTKGAL